MDKNPVHICTSFFGVIVNLFFKFQVPIVNFWFTGKQCILQPFMLLISTRSFLVNSLRISTQLYHLWIKNISIYSFFICMPFISFCLITLAKTARIVLKKIGKRDILTLLLIIRRKHSILHHYMLDLDFRCIVFYIYPLIENFF